MHACRVGHGLVHHLRDTVGPGRSIGPEPRADVPLDGSAGQVEIEPQATFGEGVRVEVAGHGIGIGHRQPLAAPSIAGRPGIGARAAGPDAQPGQLVHARNGAATGSDLDHFRDRDPHRQTAAPDEPLRPPDLERTRGTWLAVLDMASRGHAIRSPRPSLVGILALLA